MMAGQKDLPLSEWETFFRELGENQVFYVTLTGGGEPFIRSDLVEICRSIAANRMRWKIRTNGTLVTPEIAGKLAEIGHCEEIRVSIDGLREAHDAIRGEGVFDAAIRGLTILREAGLPVAVHATISRLQLGTLAPFLDYLKSLGVTRFSDGLVKPTNGKRELFQEMGLLEGKDIVETIREHRELPEPLRAMIVRSATLTLWKRWLTWLRDPASFPAIPRQERFVACSVLQRAMAVSPDGGFSPCSFHADHREGRINQEDVISAWNRLRESHQRIRCVPDPDCAVCDALPLCGYHCQGRQPYCFKEALPFLRELDHFTDWPTPEELFKCWDGH